MTRRELALKIVENKAKPIEFIVEHLPPTIFRERLGYGILFLTQMFFETIVRFPGAFTYTAETNAGILGFS